MALKKDLSGLKSQTAVVEERPLRDAPYGRMLADAWFEANPNEYLPLAGQTMFRGSESGSCGRQIQYRVTGTETTNPWTVADQWRTSVGHILHERWQESVAKVLTSAQAEVKAQIDDLISCHVDLWLPEEKVAIELKSINGFGFKKAVGAQGPAEGPKLAHKLQGAIGATALDANELRIIYLSVENLSPNVLRKMYGPSGEEFQRFSAEWAYNKEQIQNMAAPEIERLRIIRDGINEGKKIRRWSPEMEPGSRIVDPLKGTWQKLGPNGNILKVGTWWGCDYCGFQKKCSEDG